MTDFEVSVLEQLSEIKSQGATTAATCTALEARLFNQGSGVITTIQGDIQEIKDNAADDKKWTRIHNVLHYSLAPLLVLGHEIARKLGVNV